jgi:transketolase
MNQSLILKARRRLLRMHYESKVGHIGGNLSCLEILMTLYHDVMKPYDQFVLSKGHAAGSLYVTLWSKGLLTDEQLKTFHGDDTELPGHVPTGLHESVPFATGSLGHGVSLACGLALARRLRGEPGRVYCLTSDGEWNCGSTWEGLMFAKKHDLSNLCILMDNNEIQGFGRTEDVSGFQPSFKLFHEFGVDSMELRGHDLELIKTSLDYDDYQPRVWIYYTVKGHGVSFLENRMESHYDPLTREQYELAMKENEL